MATLISSQSASGASVTFSGIPDTFSDLIFDFDGISHNGATPSQLRLEVSPDGVTFSTPFTFTPGYKADQTWRGWYEVLGYGADRGFAAGVVNNAAPADPGARTAATLAWECTGGIGAVRFSWSLAGAMFDAGSFSLSGR